MIIISNRNIYKPQTLLFLNQEKVTLANFSLGIFDSIHAATCLINNKKMASTDNAYKRIPEIKAEEIKRANLEKYLPKKS